MKKVLFITSLVLTTIAVTFFSCKKDVLDIEPISTNDSSIILERKCAANDVLQEDLKSNPELAKKMDDIEKFLLVYEIFKSSSLIELTVKLINFNSLLFMEDINLL